MREIQPGLFPIRIPEGLPEGFGYCEQAISTEHEGGVLAQLADLPFKEFQFRDFEGKRRVVSFGWRYDFNDHKVLPADPIPPFLLEVYRTVQATSGFVLRDLQQVLVSEYAPGAPIGWHKDGPVWLWGYPLLHRAHFGSGSPSIMGSGNERRYSWSPARLTFFRVRYVGNGNTASRR